MSTSTKWVARIVVFVLIITGVWYWSVNNTDQAPTEPIKIGVILPLSGDLATFGNSIRTGIELSASNYSKDKVQFIYEDTPKADTQGALAAYQKLTSLDKVKIIIGPFGPEPLMAIAPAPIDGEKPLIFGVTLCDPRFQQYKNVFCTYPGLRDGTRSAVPVLKSLGLKKVYLVTIKGELGNTVESALRELSTVGGYKVIGVTKIVTTGKERDFKTDILKIKQFNPDVVYSVMTPAEGLILIRQLYELQYKGVQLAGLDVTEDVLKNLQPASDGLYLPGQMSKLDNKDFIEKYKLTYNKEPDLYSALGQSITETILSTLQKNNWKSNHLNSDVVDKTNDKTAIKGFLFNKDRTVFIPQVVLQFKSGKLIPAI